MGETKPIKITDGELQQFQAGDYLPVETTVAILTDLLNRIVIEMQAQGFEIKDPALITQFEAALKLTDI